MINTNITENLQILLYKENQSLLEKINFEDDKIFSDSRCHRSAIRDLLLPIFYIKNRLSFPSKKLKFPIRINLIKFVENYI